MVERRKYPRYALAVPVTLTCNNATPSAVAAQMIDLSAGGCYFRGALVSDVSRATISFKEARGAPFATGRIVRRGGDPGFAVTFDSIDTEVPRLASCLAILSLGVRSDFVSGFLKPEIALT